MQNWGLWAGVSSRVSLVLVALACGSDSDGDDDGALCTTFTPCGGITGDTIDNGDGPLEFCVQGDQLTIALGSDPGLEGAHQVYVRSSP